MIDVNKITSTLAKLPDAQLQQYAQMHKSDPYIMALAMTESNRRKELRAAGQGAQGMQEMPKVVDQAVAEMAPQQLPEEMGIGQLPAGDMNFAGGGIIAFADGGDVERYNGAQGSLTGDARNPFAFLNPADILGGLYGGARRIFSEGIDAEAAAKRRAAEELLAQENISGMDRRFMAPRGVATLPMAANAQPAVLPTASDAAPTAGADRKTSGAGSGAGSDTATAGGTAKGSASLEALYKKLNPSDAEYAALDTKETSVANALKNLGKSGLEEFEAEEAKRGDVFKGREERLAKREGELEGMKDKNLGLALLQAGAAIMSTPGSLGVALGKGVNVGTERYAAGLDKLNAAQERLMDAKDRLEELRVNRDDLTSRERRQLKTQAKQYELEAEKLFLDGAHKKLGYKREDAKNMFAGITTLMGQETAAGATIEAANIRSRDQNAYLAELRGGSMVEQARKNIMADITKNNPYADEPTRQRLFQTEWAKALQSNPALAKYSGVASGGGGASSADPLGLR